MLQHCLVFISLLLILSIDYDVIRLITGILVTNETIQWQHNDILILNDVMVQVWIWFAPEI